MSSYGASFVKALPDLAASFKELCRLLRDANANWLAASSTNLAVEFVVRSSEGSDWLSVQRAFAAPLLETISRTLRTTAIMIHVQDEIRLRFSYARFHDGQAIRTLEYADDGDPKGRGRWAKAEGEPEPWEALLFSPRLMELYEKHAPEEVREACAGSRIKPGFSIPWACDANTLAEIVRALQLPWEPLHQRFPRTTQTEVIPGSPERWKTFWKVFRRSRQ